MYPSSFSNLPASSITKPPTTVSNFTQLSNLRALNSNTEISQLRVTSPPHQTVTNNKPLQLNQILIDDIFNFMQKKSRLQQKNRSRSKSQIKNQNISQQSMKLKQQQQSTRQLQANNYIEGMLFDTLIKSSKKSTDQLQPSSLMLGTVIAKPNKALKSQRLQNHTPTKHVQFVR